MPSSSQVRPDYSAAVAQIAQAVAAARRGRPVVVVGIDGPAGSGKSTLAAAVGASLVAPVVHMDDLYDGWTGLRAGFTRLRDQVLAPLERALDVSFLAYDWSLGAYVTERHLTVVDALVVEGVGAGAAEARPYIDVAVWLDASEATRKERALRRGGENFAEHWDAWAALEAEYFASDEPATHADLTYETS